MAYFMLPSACATESQHLFALGHKQITTKIAVYYLRLLQQERCCALICLTRTRQSLKDGPDLSTGIYYKHSFMNFVADGIT
jgi:hypothetical protein